MPLLSGVKSWHPVHMLCMSLLFSVNPDWMLLVSVVPGWSPCRAWPGSRDPPCYIGQHWRWRRRDPWHVCWGAYAQGNVAHLLLQPNASPEPHYGMYTMHAIWSVNTTQQAPSVLCACNIRLQYIVVMPNCCVFKGCYF